MSDSALSVSEVLWEERQALVPARPPGQPGSADPKNNDRKPDDLAAVYRRLNHDNRWALCLSGGGIRSAAFALGVIQRLAAQQVAPKIATDDAGSALQQFEYLSTVSGGGYIGSWLSAWLFQERKKPGKTSGGANQVMADLNRRTTNDAEVKPITHLRRDSRYLAPSFSAISPDLWSDIAAFSRNLCLNWILLVPPMILAVLFTKAASYPFIEALYMAGSPSSWWFWAIIIAATAGFIAALSFSVANRPARGLINASQNEFLIYDVTIFLISAAVLVFVLGSDSGREALTFVVNKVLRLDGLPLEIAILIRGPLLGAGIYAASWVATAVILARKPQYPWKASAWYALVDLGSWCVAGAAFGAMIAAGYLVADRLLTVPMEHSPIDPARAARIAALVCTLGVPWVLSARIIADVIFISFAKFIPGADAGLEYQARSGGILTLAQLGWLLWFGLVLGSPIAERSIESHTAAWLAAAGGVLSGAFALTAGFYSKAGDIAQKAVTLRRHLSLNTLAAIAAAICGIAIVAWLSIMMDLFLDLFKAEGAAYVSWTVVAIAGAVLGILIAAASRVIGINEYSLHSIYRNRLVRAFLGASRDTKIREASKNRFTDFDSLDSPLLHELWQDGINPRGDNWRPLHIINAAVNLVSSRNLAWQERMAAPFTFSPLHCGSGSSIFTTGAYRRTYPPQDQGKPYGDPDGLTLGTAMAISGAALSPNMGYNTSPGVAFLMALCNVRLGWWLPNPHSENSQYWLTSPRWALQPYFIEMFGLTSENRRWVYLSDGGHFDNLGIYEMVRRRCRVIVVSDAGCDPHYAFADLGNALRKIWIDLGVRIEIDGLDRLKTRFKKRPTPAKHAPYWAVGRIRYTAADGGGEDGWLLYLKSGLHGTEPMDVLSYAMSHPAFPHEPTSQQFFTESQFESYRMLGFEIVSRAFEAAGISSAEPAAACAAASGQAGAAGVTLNAVIERLDAQLKAPDDRSRRPPRAGPHTPVSATDHDGGQPAARAHAE